MSHKEPVIRWEPASYNLAHRVADVSRDDWGARGGRYIVKRSQPYARQWLVYFEGKLLAGPYSKREYGMEFVENLFPRKDG